MKLVTPDQAHIAFREDMIATLRRHGANLPADNLLSIAAYTVGQLVALQDQQTMTPDQTMRIVLRNIEQGNADAISQLLGNPAGAA
jgi:hypothetical protein